jgi:hypothetical protein
MVSSLSDYNSNHKYTYYNGCSFDTAESTVKVPPICSVLLFFSDLRPIPSHERLRNQTLSKLSSIQCWISSDYIVSDKYSLLFASECLDDVMYTPE